MSLAIQLVPQSATSVKEVALLFYSEYGARVAVLDLRQHGLRNFILDGEPLDFRVHVPHLPLVEGKYRLGFYIATSEHAEDFLDVAVVTVRAAEPRDGIVPYPADYRGLIDLDFPWKSKGPQQFPDDPPRHGIRRITPRQWAKSQLVQPKRRVSVLRLPRVTSREDAVVFEPPASEGFSRPRNIRICSACVGPVATCSMSAPTSA